MSKNIIFLICYINLKSHKKIIKYILVINLTFKRKLNMKYLNNIIKG